MAKDVQYWPAMTSLRVVTLFLAVSAGCVGAAPDEPPGDDASDPDILTINAGSRRILVYSNNVENMIFDWKDLIYYMSTRPSRPDIFLVQQMTGPARMKEMTDAMADILGVPYDGRVAQENPTNLRVGTEISPRPTNTTAIIFRSSRFSVVSQETWFPWGQFDATTGTINCSVRNSNSGYQTLKLRLHDNVAGRDVVVVSLRHPTSAPCPAQNALDIDAHLPPHVGLSIVGGDFNENPTETNPKGECWYRSMVGGLNACSGDRDLHFADPLYDFCAGDMTCVQKRQNIDQIFGRNQDSTPAKTSDYQRAAFEDGDAADIAVTGSDGPSNTVAADGFKDVSSQYSQPHKARSAFFYYP